MTRKPARIWELDALRGIAIILMALFHTIFSLNVFYGYKNFNYAEGFWFYEGRVSAILFIVLVGVAGSLTLKRYGKNEALKKNAYRGLRLIGLGMLVTVASYFFDPANTIWFGILHFLGVAVLISIPLLEFTGLNLLLAAILLAAYYPISAIRGEGYLGLIFGIYPPGFQTYDHYALIPWLGFVLIGVALSNWLYKNGKPLIKRQPSLPEKALTLAGRYSLWIYIIHVPVILTLMWLFLPA
jgi:uncharacterized membrane protein